MKFLVTGGAGFIGSNVVDGLIEAGYEVVVVDNLVTGKVENVNPKATFYEVDITSSDLEEVFERERPDYVNHHAAQMNVRKSVEDPIYDAEVNVLGSINLLELCRRYGVRKVIYASTGGAVYGEPLYLPVDEDHPINPLSPYGVTKHAVEHYLYFYGANYDLRYTILRYPNIYGPRQDPHGEAGVVAIFTERMLRGERPVIFGDGTQTRDYVYVGDVVTANLLAIDKGDGEAYNVGTGIETSVNELFELLREVIGADIEPIYGEKRLGEVYRIAITNDKIYRDFGWKPQTSLREGLFKTIEYYRRMEGGVS
jgi:UDP-glucose 4-epimerase